MIQYTCDVCGKPMPENYIRPKQRSGQLTRACRVDDVCASCEAAGRQIDVSGTLLAAWRAAPRPSSAECNPPDETVPQTLLREHSIAEPAMTGRGSTEKAAILDRLRQYRKDHGLGCLAIVAEKAGRDITDDVLRGVLQGKVTLDIKGWRQIGKALDKLAAAGEGDGG